jgi:SdrD B-like protein/cadherin domain-containing protein
LPNGVFDGLGEGAILTDGDNEFEITYEGGDGNDVVLTYVVSNQPPSIDDQSFEVDENQTPVGTVVATDPDLPDDTLTYSIGGGPDGHLFTIDSATGAMSFLAAADFEMPLDANQDNLYELEVTVADGDAASDTASVTVSVLNLASISGDVFVDVNENGLREVHEPGIDGVVIELLDASGNLVTTTTTSDGGFYLFDDLEPGTYQLHEVQPTGVDDGAEILGSLGGTIPADDTMQLQLTLDRIDAADYIFAELGQNVTNGDTATIGFWQNKHGQDLIALGGPDVAAWLTANFGNVFGDVFSDDIGTDDGAEVAAFFRDQLFRHKSSKSAGPAKVDAQFMAVALASYFTSNNLAGGMGAGFGFNVTDTGIGTKIVNVADNGAAFDVADDTDLTIMQLLLATNSMTDLPDGISGFAHIYDRNGDGEIDSAEALLRTLANDVYSAINEQGDI